MNKPEAFTEPQTDRTQSYYQLACIQSVSISLPVAFIGKQLFEQYGPGTAICSVLVANLVLWLIGLGIISMVYHAHTNAVANIIGHFGKYGGGIFAFTLIISIMLWYISQINSTIVALHSTFQYSFPWPNGFDIRIGAVLGLLSAILAIGGINLLKWITVALFPLFLVYNIVSILTSNSSISFSGSWGLSLSGIVATVLILIPGVINLPTFFRHSRSKADSFLALTLMTLFITFFECSTIWMSFSEGLEFLISPTNEAPNFIYFVIPTTLFLILTLTCSNLLNIYLAAACYETFIPKFSSTKGHAIMGLLGTAAYTFIQISSPVNFLINLFDDYIAIIGVVLLIAVLARLIIRHRPRKLEKLINFTTWIAGCAIATYFEILHPDQTVQPLFYGMGGSVLFFLAVFFIEETAWAIKKLMSKRALN